MSAAIILVALVAGAFSFVAAFNEAHELQDDILRQVADATAAAGVADAESQLIVASLTQPGSAGAPRFAATLKDGLQTVPAHETSYRVLVKTRSDGERIAVAQAAAVRDEIALGISEGADVRVAAAAQELRLEIESRSASPAV